MAVADVANWMMSHQGEGPKPKNEFCRGTKTKKTSNRKFQI